jgi:hypothetical protein
VAFNCSTRTPQLALYIGTTARVRVVAMHTWQARHMLMLLGRHMPMSENTRQASVLLVQVHTMGGLTRLQVWLTMGQSSSLMQLPSGGPVMVPAQTKEGGTGQTCQPESSHRKRFGEISCTMDKASRLNRGKVMGTHPVAGTIQDALDRCLQEQDDCSM